MDFLNFLLNEEERIYNIISIKSNNRQLIIKDIDKKKI
jgi:hypothetical protein